MGGAPDLPLRPLTGDDDVSPYLLRPRRTMAQARADRVAHDLWLALLAADPPPSLPQLALVRVVEHADGRRVAQLVDRATGVRMTLTLAVALPPAAEAAA